MREVQAKEGGVFSLPEGKKAGGKIAAPIDGENRARSVRGERRAKGKKGYVTSSPLKVNVS